MLATLLGGLRGAASHTEGLRAAAPVLPCLSRQARCYGFGSHMSDNDPEVMEKEKQKQLKGKAVSHIKSVPGWSERLASDSEAAIKAERECPDCPVEEMQRETIEVLQTKASQEEEREEVESGSPEIKEPRSGALGGA